MSFQAAWLPSGPMFIALRRQGRDRAGRALAESGHDRCGDLRLGQVGVVLRYRRAGSEADGLRR